MSAMTPESDVATALQTAGVGNFSGGGTKTIICGPPVDQVAPGADGLLVFVMPAGGLPPMPFLNASVEGSLYDAEVDVLVRGADDTYQAALTKARAVRDALHVKEPSGYIGCWAQTSEPIYLGRSVDGQHEFKVNFSLRWKATG